MAKFIFVTGGVVSSLGKGVTAASLGRLLKNRGYKVFMQKFDPYINVDPGMMSPYQHGEVFVTKDGAETDLDLGHYERFIDVELTKESSITTGKIYQKVINRERAGEYEGATVQVIPHVTNEIKQKVLDAATSSNADIVITEIGGTVGDIESLPFIEAIRQIKRDVGKDCVCYVHTTLVPYIAAAKEVKTKPTQHSVKELRSYGIHPDIVVCRTEKPLMTSVKEKIALFCDLEKNEVIEAVDTNNIFRVPQAFLEQEMDVTILKKLNLEVHAIDMTEWDQLIQKVENTSKTINLALVGKYVQLHDAYLSVAEAIKSAGYEHGAKIEIKWINSEAIDASQIVNELEGMDAILIPGGFGGRGIDGKIQAIRFARENNVPFLGICLGMQLAVIEYARHVCKLENVDSQEWSLNIENPIVHLLPGQNKEKTLEESLRLGNWTCHLQEGSIAYNLYGRTSIQERHRHRYEINTAYCNTLEDHGLLFSGKSEDGLLMEIIELPGHPFFVACQFHPEFTSRPTKPQPLFSGLIKAAIEKK